MNNLPDLYQNEDSVAYYKSGFGDEYLEETLSDVWENCVIESVTSIYNSVYKVVLLNVIFGLVTTFSLPEVLFHWLSALCGIYVLVTTIRSTVGLAVVFASFTLAYIIIVITRISTQPGRKCNEDYSLQQTTSSNFYSASLIQYCLIALFVLFEYVVLERGTWLEIRGIMMVFSMKLISIVTDLPLSKFPGPWEYFGYMFCSGNILFGPWITFEHYMLQVKHPSKKNIYWLIGIVKALVYSVVFLSISNCWASYLIGDYSNSLLIGYKEALSFRMSHYFVSYLSEALIVAAGWKHINHQFNDEQWSFPVTNFLKIELPTSLSVVVVHWNKPMHEFLKKYIYRKWLPSGKFRAILLTFLLSSLFHGLDLKISTVLLSLGVFSYLQILVREHISQAFDMCVKVHPCKSCQHKFKRDSIISRVSLWINRLTKLVFTRNGMI